VNVNFFSEYTTSPEATTKIFPGSKLVMLLFSLAELSVEIPSDSDSILMREDHHFMNFFSSIPTSPQNLIQFSELCFALSMHDRWVHTPSTPHPLFCVRLCFHPQKKKKCLGFWWAYGRVRENYQKAPVQQVKHTNRCDPPARIKHVLVE